MPKRWDEQTNKKISELVKKLPVDLGIKARFLKELEEILQASEPSPTDGVFMTQASQSCGGARESRSMLNGEDTKSS